MKTISDKPAAFLEQKILRRCARELRGIAPVLGMNIATDIMCSRKLDAVIADLVRVRGFADGSCEKHTAARISKVRKALGYSR